MLLYFSDLPRRDRLALSLLAVDWRSGRPHRLEGEHNFQWLKGETAAPPRYSRSDRLSRGCQNIVSKSPKPTSPRAVAFIHGQKYLCTRYVMLYIRIYSA